MADECHYNFLKKISRYPIINEAVERVPKCYQWLKSQSQILNITLTKAENVLTAITYTTEPIVESRLKSIDNVLYNQLGKFEKIFFPIIEKPTMILQESYHIYVKNVRPTIERTSEHIERLVKIFPLKFPSKLDIDNFICDMLEKVFDKLIPDPDDTESVSGLISHSHIKPNDPSMTEHFSLSSLTISEVEDHCQLNSDLLGRVQFLSSEPNGEIDDSLIKEFFHSVLEHYKKLEVFLLKLKTIPPDNLTDDINVSLYFLDKNLCRLQGLLDDCQSGLASNTLIFQSNFVLDQIQSGLYSFIYNLRNHIEDPQESKDLESGTTSDSFFTQDDEDLSE